MVYHIQLSSMMMMGKKTEIDIDENQTVNELKHRVQSVFGNVQNCSIYKINGERLEPLNENYTISQCNIPQNAQLIIWLKPELLGD